MAQHDVDDTASLIPCSNAMVQNLGPGSVFLAVGDDATEEEGVQLLPGQAIVFTGVSKVSAISDSTADVRTIGRAIGIFSVEAS